MDATYWPPFQPSPSSSSSSLSSLPTPLSPADLKAVVNHSVTPALINHLVDKVQHAVDFGLDRSPEPPAYANRRARNHTRTWHSQSRYRSGSDAARERQAIYDFTASLLRRAEVSFSTVLGALVYIDRAKPHLSIAIEGD